MPRFLDELVKRAASLDLQACCNGLWSIGVLQVGAGREIPVLTLLCWSM